MSECKRVKFCSYLKNLFILLFISGILLIPSLSAIPIVDYTNNKGYSTAFITKEDAYISNHLTGDFNDDGYEDLFLVKNLAGDHLDEFLIFYGSSDFYEKFSDVVQDDQADAVIKGISGPVITIFDINKDGVVDITYTQSSYLFTMNRSMKNYIINGSVGIEIKEAFRSNEIFLSDNATFFWKFDWHWKIQDGENSYVASDNIYGISVSKVGNSLIKTIFGSQNTILGEHDANSLNPITIISSVDVDDYYFGDINGNGAIDLVTSMDNFYDDHIWIYYDIMSLLNLNETLTDFDADLELDLPMTETWKLGDVNGDNFDDIVYCYDNDGYDRASYGIKIIFGNYGIINLTGDTIVTKIIPEAYSPRLGVGIIINDINNDGYQDLIIGIDAYYNKYIIFGQASFPEIYDLSIEPVVILLADDDRIVGKVYITSVENDNRKYLIISKKTPLREYNAYYKLDVTELNPSERQFITMSEQEQYVFVSDHLSGDLFTTDFNGDNEKEVYIFVDRPKTEGSLQYDNHDPVLLRIHLNDEYFEESDSEFKRETIFIIILIILILIILPLIFAYIIKQKKKKN